MSNKMEKILAKVIYYTINTFTLIAILLLILSFCTMVEAMAITFYPMVTFIVCAIWIATYAMIIRFLEN